MRYPCRFIIWIGKSLDLAMYQVIIVIHVLLGLGVVGLILMQQGKGADAGAAFGTGSSSSVFGAQGAASFLSRSTAILATLFFTTSLGLAILNGQRGSANDLITAPKTQDEITTISAPAQPKSPEDIPAQPATISEPAPAVETQVQPNPVDTAVSQPEEAKTEAPVESAPKVIEKPAVVKEAKPAPKSKETKAPKKTEKSKKAQKQTD